MPVRFGITTTIGRDLTNLANSRGAYGQSLEAGDAFDVASGVMDGAPGSPAQQDVGYTSTDRKHVHWSFPTALDTFAGAVIQSCRAVFYSPRSTFTAGFPGASVTINIHGVRKPMDITDLTFAYYDATGSLAWATMGGKPGVDMTSAPVGQLIFTLAQHGASKANLTPLALTPVELRAEFQYVVDRGKTALLLQMRPTWTKTVTGQSEVAFDDPVITAATSAHSYLAVVWTPELGAFADDGTGAPNLAAFLDWTIVDQDAAVQAGSPQPGGAGPDVSVVMVNSGVNEINGCGAIRQGSYAESVVQPVGGPTLKYVDHLDSITGQLGMTGALRLYADPGDTSKYKAEFAPLGASAPIALQTSAGAAFGLYTADVTWRHVTSTSLNAFVVLARDWSATTAASGKQWLVGLVADQQPADALEGAEDRYYLAPPDGPAAYHEATPVVRTTSMSGQRRQLSRARFEQCWANSDVVNVSGTDRTRLFLRHHANWADEMQLTVFNADGTVWHHAEILSVETGGADIDSVTLTEELVDDVGATVTYDATSSVCSGVMPLYATGAAVGRLKKPDRGRLEMATGTSAPIGSLALALEAPLTSIGGSGAQISLYRSATGEREVRSFTRTGTTLALTGGTTLAHEDDDLVQVVASDWHGNFYVQLRPELQAEPREQKAMPRLTRWVPR